MTNVKQVLRKLIYGSRAWKRPSSPLDSQQAERILSRSDLCDQVLEVRELYAGWNAIYLVKTEAESYCFRVYTNDFGDYGTDWKPQKEKYVLDALLAGGVKVPRVYHADGTRALLDYPYVVMEYKLGMPARRAAQQSTWTDDVRYRFLREAGREMALIHTTGMRGLGILSYRLDCSSSWKPRNCVDQYLSRCQEASARDKIGRYLEQMIDVLPNEPALVPVHTEFTDRNILVLPDQNFEISSVIDMEWFLRSIPEHEFARLTIGWLQHIDRGNDLETDLEALLAGYYEHGGVLTHPQVIPAFVLLNQFLLKQPAKIDRKRVEEDWERLRALDKLVPTFEKAVAKASRESSRFQKVG